MPFYPNGSYYPWSTYLNLNNTGTDPVSGILLSTFNADPFLIPFFCGCLYVFLWMRFNASPSRFKITSIAALVLVISIVCVFSGFEASAVLNFVAFILAYFLSLLFKA